MDEVNMVKEMMEEVGNRDRAIRIMLHVTVVFHNPITTTVTT